MNTSPLLLIDIAWTLGCLFTLVKCLRRLKNTRIDSAAADTDRTRSIAMGNMITAGSRSYRQLFFVIIGLRSLYGLYDPTWRSVAFQFAIGVAFVSLAILDHFEVDREIRTQRRLLAAGIALERRRHAWPHPEEP